MSLAATVPDVGDEDANPGGEATERRGLLAGVVDRFYSRMPDRVVAVVWTVTGVAIVVMLAWSTLDLVVNGGETADVLPFSARGSPFAGVLLLLAATWTSIAKRRWSAFHDQSLFFRRWGPTFFAVAGALHLLVWVVLG